ncbi:MAG: hypothetical protein GWN58_12870, partial [Anaerolineae bacterium]|nr:hypothetical protein [Thermoplasmata archaeon]NIV30343.1 hypothetical protein [Anaerolineae bacterium]NIY05614.1 hypothetical protein [Thermoplasmata archaeon]
MTQITKASVRTRKGTPRKVTAPETGIQVTVSDLAGGTIQGRKPGQVQTLKGVFFGPPKTGKTSVACSGKNVLLISFDPDGDLTETIAGR